jgi:hypothetical protein
MEKKIKQYPKNDQKENIYMGTKLGLKINVQSFRLSTTPKCILVYYGFR